MSRRGQVNPTRDAYGAVSRAAILAAARELFRAQGYEAVTTRQITKAANRSTGSLFAHWSGKDALFTEAMGRPPFTDVMGARLWVRLSNDLRALGYLNAEATAFDVAQTYEDPHG